jgi:hypothetical protein
MNSARFDLTEDEILAAKVTDEALEQAACIVKDCPVVFTTAFCSGLDTCPA